MAGPKTCRIDALICWHNGATLTLNGVARKHPFSGQLGGGDDGGDGDEVGGQVQGVRPGDSAGHADDWTKDGGAKHVTGEDCAAAPESAPPVVLRGPQPERPEDRERIERLLLGHPWKTATSMPKIPHEYTLRRLWHDDGAFIRCVDYIRAVGYEARFGGQVYKYYDIAEHQYFPCFGDTVSPIESKNAAILINRAVKKKPSQRPSTPTLGFE